MGLRLRAGDIYENALVAQRLKRVSSIEFKFRRFPKRSLARMQDIGGCRAVLRSPAQVRRLTRDYKASRIKHVLVGEKDCIGSPKVSGYRRRTTSWPQVSKPFSIRSWISRRVCIGTPPPPWRAKWRRHDTRFSAKFASGGTRLGRQPGTSWIEDGTGGRGSNQKLRVKGSSSWSNTLSGRMPSTPTSSVASRVGVGAR